MKKIFILSVSLLASLLLIPLTATTKKTEPLTALQTSVPIQPPKNPQTIKVLISKTGKTEEIALEDYLFGVVAGEMPALYEADALKAQAICANTFLQWRKKENAQKGYDISDNYTVDQCYVSKDEARKKWGSKADEYESKIKEAIKEVKNQTLAYNGEIILSVYHSVSSGKTESAKNVWGKDYPYLQAVDSSADRQSEHCVSKNTFTLEELKTALSLATPQNASQNIFSNFDRTQSGIVKTVKILDKEYKGQEIRTALNLKSSNFKVKFENGNYNFTVYGYGHGVGMSQNGANEMAKQGKTYEEILKHYYTGTEIINS
ncbi:MAG: stage II sporulation protein D [Ruminococcaceae bacterium]|nr:stage II sporulation protein D [Oscillospiraceae bacterium]